LGIQFRLRAKIGKDIALGDLEAEYDGVLLAVGAEADKALGIKGEDLPGVHPGYEYLDLFARKRAPKLGSEVLVIGGGNVALDAARTIFRMGKKATIAYRRTKADMPANAQELLGADEEGIPIVPMVAPLEILSGKNGRVSGVRFRVMKSGPTDRSGRPAPVPTEETLDIPCTDVIVAVGEKVDSAAMAGAGIGILKDGRLKVDPFTLRTALPTVWATGDSVSGPATAAEAMGAAKQVAREIDRVLMGQDRFKSLFKNFDYAMEIPLEVEGNRKNRPRHLPADQRKGNFVEINLGYDGDQAISEVRRCLRCDVRPNACSPWR
jgi:NADPH-dependent glutamate synthase beta subunit-like oxidoreductase